MKKEGRKKDGNKERRKDGWKKRWEGRVRGKEVIMDRKDNKNKRHGKYR